MDDPLTGCDSIEELLEIQRDITNILRSGRFQLRKWLSNSAEVISKLEVNTDIDSSILQIVKMKVIKH